jgi:hypothetical protein
VEVNAAKLMTSTHEGRIRVSKKNIDWCYDRAMQTTHTRPEAQERLFAELSAQAAKMVAPQIVPIG